MKNEKLDFPEKIVWSSTRKIESADINEAHHMGNDRILVWADTDRKHFFTELDWDFKLGWIVANHEIQYRSEGFLNDKIDIEISMDYLTEYSLDLFIRYKKAEIQRNMVLMRTGLVCFDLDKREVTPIPTQLYSKLKKMISTP